MIRIDRFPSDNPERGPIYLNGLDELVGKLVLVEARSGDRYTGHLRSVDAVQLHLDIDGGAGGIQLPFDAIRRLGEAP
jgi:hypothetical protein